MSLIKKLFGALTEKPWEQDQAVIDSGHSGKTFEISNQMSAVISSISILSYILN